MATKIVFDKPLGLPPIPPYQADNPDADDIFNYLRDLHLLVTAVDLDTCQYRLENIWHGFRREHME